MIKRLPLKGANPPFLFYACPLSWCHSLGSAHNWALAMHPLPVCHHSKWRFGFGIPFKKSLLVDTVTRWGRTPSHTYIAFSKKWLKTPLRLQWSATAHMRGFHPQRLVFHFPNKNIKQPLGSLFRMQTDFLSLKPMSLGVPDFFKRCSKVHSNIPYDF